MRLSLAEKKGRTLMIVGTEEATIGIGETLSNMTRVDEDLMEKCLKSHTAAVAIHGLEIAGHVRENVHHLMCWLDPVMKNRELDAETREYANELWARLVKIAASVNTTADEYAKLRLEFSDLLNVLEPVYSKAALEAL